MGRKPIYDIVQTYWFEGGAATNHTQSLKLILEGDGSLIQANKTVPQFGSVRIYLNLGRPSIKPQN